ncbi:MAG: beta-glucosidase [Verrucomicrobia bacterium]|nr:beta-glucosidase [Verrucomicrobiota bacterium]MDA1066145.1 beta-glucosidase [Verrucomicrobiota bacterium]
MHILPLIVAATAFLYGCQKPINETGFAKTAMSDEELLDFVQSQSFKYFWDYAEPSSGLARERYHPDGDYPLSDSNIVTTGGTGFGVMAILVGIERGYIGRAEGIARLTRIVDFLEKADQFHGVWPHWLNGETGKTKPFSKKDDGGDLVESSFLIQGLLCVRQYCDQKVPKERRLAEQINALWQEMEWDWYTQKSENLYWHWSPNYGFEMDFALRGYNETLITHVLAASSPTHGTQAEVYHHCWARDGAVEAEDTYYGLDRVLDHYDTDDSPVGPLFWAHYSYLGLDPRNLEDAYGNYWDLNRNHALTHYRHCVENPNGYGGYGEDCWGLTSSYSPKNGTIGYASHRPDKDIGVISPTAAISSIPYTPEESLKAMRGFVENYGELLNGPAGLYDAFRPDDGWVAPRYLAIDQGPMIVMIENFRSGLFWDLFMSCEEVQSGLDKLGFTYKK